MDGVYYLDGVLDTETGAMLRTALDSLMGPPARDDERSWPQRRHDALGDLVRRQLDSGDLPQVGGQRPHLTLTASVATLARMPGSKAADLDWGQPVSAELLRRVACDCELTCILVDEKGDPLSVGRTSRTFTPAQRRPWQRGTAAACCAVARRPGATVTTASTGSTGARPLWRTERSSVNAATIACTRAATSWCESRTDPGPPFVAHCHPEW